MYLIIFTIYQLFFAAKLADDQPSLINYGKHFNMRALSHIRSRALNISEQFYWIIKQKIYLQKIMFIKLKKVHQKRLVL